MTAHALQGYREICLKVGLDAYISKPIRADDLFQAIDSLVPAQDSDYNNLRDVIQTVNPNLLG